MSVGYYHGLCNRYRGRAVEIRTRDGRSHRGIIQRVDNRNVYVRPIGRGGGLGGFGYGFFGGYGRYRPGFGYGIALGAIGTLALLPFFFW
ncbi:hypothetical protein [Oceanobacillus rekensis]|uniref:hypothetical protein n=1 Tax=Oceanobacillus rekensis TaxID=937927 RepID=UPI000B4538C4|nr:hypothetical protein [Oceanobacillus rekensis]